MLQVVVKRDLLERIVYSFFYALRTTTQDLSYTAFQVLEDLL